MLLGLGQVTLSRLSQIHVHQTLHITAVIHNRCVAFQCMHEQFSDCAVCAQKFEKKILTSRNVATLHFGLNAFRVACSIRLGLFVLSLLRMLFACILDTLYSKNVGTRHSVRNMALAKFCILFTFSKVKMMLYWMKIYRNDDPY